jgi:PAS domain S-box-containing protein
MPLQVRAKETLAVTVLVVVAVVTTNVIHLGHLTRVAIEAAVGQAELIVRQVYVQGNRALARATAATPDQALARDAELRALLDASIAYSPQVLDVALVDRDGRVIVHSEREREGQLARARPALSSLLALDPLRRVSALHRGNGSYEVALPLTLNGQPFGSVRVGVSASLLKREIGAALRYSALLAGLSLPVAWLAAMALASLVLRPLRTLAGQMERVRRGEGDVAAELTGRRGEIGQLASQLQQLGRDIQSDRLRVLQEKTELQRLADHLEDGIVLLDDDGRVLFANRTAESGVGQTLDAMVGYALVDVLAPSHPLRGLLEQAYERRATLRNARVELPLDQSWKEFLVSILLVSDTGPSRAAVVLLRDLESVKTVQTLISYSAKLAALGNLTSGLAHEVKNPLQAMVLHVALLKNRLAASSPEVRESLDIVGNEIRRLDRVVQGFLSFARPQEVKPRPLDLNGLATSLVALVEPEWRAQGVQFTLALDPALPLVSGDEDLLRQALLNLTRNACQAMASGGTATIATAQDDEYVRVSIADEGVGIEPEDRDKIFGLYFTTKPDGNGVGLAVVYRIIQMHDGTIDVESEVGRGTTMTVRLPRR